MVQGFISCFGFFADERLKNYIENIISFKIQTLKDLGKKRKYSFKVETYGCGKKTQSLLLSFDDQDETMELYTVLPSRNSRSDSILEMERGFQSKYKLGRYQDSVAVNTIENLRNTLVKHKNLFIFSIYKKKYSSRKS